MIENRIYTTEFRGREKWCYSPIKGSGLEGPLGVGTPPTLYQKILLHIIICFLWKII